jgi:hypothetical protein
MESHKKKSVHLGTSRSSDRKRGSGKSGMGGNSNSSSNRQEWRKSAEVGDKRHEDRKYNIFVEPEGDTPSPPPPPIISADNKQRGEYSPSKGSVFRDVKLPKGRNYMRRNLAATGDVDLRLGGPPEKRPHVDMFEPDTTASVPSAEEDVKSKLTEFQFSCLVTGFVCFGGSCFFGKPALFSATVHLFLVAHSILSRPSFIMSRVLWNTEVQVG